MQLSDTEVKKPSYFAEFYLLSPGVTEGEAAGITRL